MSGHRTALAAASAAGIATVLAVVALTHEAGEAGTRPDTPQARVYRLTAFPEPGNVLVRPAGTDEHTAGTVVARVERNYAKGGVPALWLRLMTVGLSGPVTAVHLHTGAPGAAGPVILTFCGGDSEIACTSLSGTRRSGTLLSIFAGPTYIDVHTRRNPEGELRGQIELTPMLSPAEGGL